MVLDKLPIFVYPLFWRFAAGNYLARANRLSVGLSRFRDYVRCADVFTSMQLCAAVLLSKLLSRFRLLEE